MVIQMDCSWQCWNMRVVPTFWDEWEELLHLKKAHWRKVEWQKLLSVVTDMFPLETNIFTLPSLLEKCVGGRGLLGQRWKKNKKLSSFQIKLSNKTFNKCFLVSNHLPKIMCCQCQHNWRALIKLEKGLIERRKNNVCSCQGLHKGTPADSLSTLH